MIARQVRRLTLCLLLCLCPIVADAADSFPASSTQKIEAEIKRSIARRSIPGGVVWLERGETRFSKALGKRSLVPAGEAMSLDTIFDAASLTKVVATVPSILKLIEQGKLSLEDKVQSIIPELTGDPNKAEITVRHLLTHTSGLAAGIKLGFEWKGYANGIAQVCAEPSGGIAGLSYRYSDLNFILLGEIVWRVSGQRLDEFSKENIFDPLKMVDTSFTPSITLRNRIAPTTKMADGSVLRGVVHDPSSRAMGGVTGHAGLFTTAADLARYARMWLGGGEVDGVRVLESDSVMLGRTVQTPPLVTARRGLGWDIDSPYAGPRGEVFPLGSFGHTGWTGTSLWIDPFSKSFLIFLSNRNHPSESGSVVSLRKRLGTLAGKAVEAQGFDFKKVKGALPKLPRNANEALREAIAARRGGVRNGIDVLVAGQFDK